MMRYVNKFMREYLRARMARIERMKKSARDEQLHLLQQLLNKATDTRFGKQYGFQHLKNYSQFSQSVPISTYEKLQPYFELIKNGESNVLWPGKVNYFAKSSGTTDRSKYIPLTTNAIDDNHVKGGKDLMAMYYHRFPNSKVFSGKSFITGGSLSEHWGSIGVGDVSAVLLHRMPEWLQYFREPSRQIATMNNWDEKVEAIAQRIANENITTLSGVPTWMMVIMKRVLEISKKDTITEVWPNLELFVHGGIDFTPYKHRFENLVGKSIHYVNTYNASEGFFAFQDSEEEGMLLHTGCNVFYEFIPFHEFDTNSEGQNTVSIEHVELYKRYALVISTNSGLWRYAIGDVVEFTSLNPFRIKIAGRTKQCINMFGEELMVHNTDTAIAQACNELSCSAAHYTVAPTLTSNGYGYHQWLIEFETTPEDLLQFSSLLDSKLRLLNSDYDAKRTADIILKQLQIVAVKKNTFYTWLKAKGKLGGQHKVPRLKNDTGFITNLTKISQQL